MAQVTETNDERCDYCGMAIEPDSETSVLGILMHPEGMTQLVQVGDRICWQGLLDKGWRELNDEEMQGLREKVNRSILGDDGEEKGRA